MIKKRIRTIICILAIFQIILLLNAIVAQPYLIHEAEKSKINISNISKKDNNPAIQKTLILLIGILSIKQIGTVSAAIEKGVNYSAPEYTLVTSSTSFSVGCCQELKNGAICEDVLKTDSASCKTSILPTECSQIDSCKIGCCIDPIEGTCTTKTLKGKCIAEGGEWNSEQNCQIIECQKGCCVLGTGAQFVNEKTCERLSLLYGFKKDFKQLDTEIECLALIATQEIGACTYNSGGCDFTTEKTCLENLGKFYKGYLCSNPSLETNCTKQASINCMERKDEIYWFDSCGNRENIYDSNKNASWNNGKILSKNESCNPTSSNFNSTSCGNCNRALSSVCSNSSVKKVVDGNFICKSLECRDEDGNVRQNGESWCLYDSYIGEGKDTAGSEHWRAFCNKGTVEVDICGNYRGRICVQSVMKSKTKNFSVAACATNTAFQCTTYNGEEPLDMKELCEKNEFCTMKNINIASGFSFNYCAPKYPKGFDTSLFETNKKVCSTADVKCSVKYKKGFMSGWSCEDNCECETKAFTDKMNDFCISLGDCGSYINFEGRGTNNTKISGAPATNWKEYLNYGKNHTDYSKPVKGQYAEAKSLNDTLYLLLGGAVPENMDDEDAFRKAIDLSGKIMGGMGLVTGGLAAVSGSEGGIAATILSYQMPGTVGYAGSVGSAASSTSSVFFGGTGTTGAIPTCGVTVAGIGAAAAGAALGMMVGSYLASSQGITGTPATIMMIAGAVAGAILAYGAWLVAIKSTATIWPVGTIVAIVMIAIMALISLSGWGKTEMRTVSFTCMPWEAPLGGDDCAKCNDDPRKPCTEYRCSSLGQACVLLNPEAEFPTCKSLPKENIAPVISPGEPSEGYDFEDITENGLKIVGEKKECIQEFTPVSFTLKTDEFAQCIYSYTLPESKVFEDMGGANYPKEGNAFTENHTFGIFMPSIGSLSVYDLAGDLKEKYGKMNMYVRCRDYWGNYNIDEYIVNFCVHSGPDITPVNHAYTTTIPKNGAILKYGTTEVNMSMYINEPAECKYSNSSGKTFDEMENSMTCETDVMNPTNFGWECTTTMPTLKIENKIYIKCKDQPWLAGTPEEVNRTINQDDYVYALYVTETPLNITSVSPEGTLIRGFEPISLDLEVKTAGGSEDGIAYCYWGEERNILFYESYSRYHKQTLTTVIAGTFKFPIKCEDSAGNAAETEINFTVELDTSPPIVVRTYREGSNLVVLTNKLAECYYDFHTCDFDLDHATSMTTALSTVHRAPWEPGRTYYVKCKDIWGNTNPWCAIRVQPE